MAKIGLKRMGIKAGSGDALQIKWINPVLMDYISDAMGKIIAGNNKRLWVNFQEDLRKK